MNNLLQPGQSYSKMYGTEVWYDETGYNKIPDITNKTQKPKLTIIFALV